MTSSPDEVDVITTVMISRRLVYDGNRAKPGVHVNVVGLYVPDARELRSLRLIGLGCLCTTKKRYLPNQEIF